MARITKDGKEKTKSFADQAVEIKAAEIKVAKLHAQLLAQFINKALDKAGDAPSPKAVKPIKSSQGDINKAWATYVKETV